MRALALLCLLVFLLAPVPASSQPAPQETSVCSLSSAPQTFNGKDVRVRGFIDLSFEDFTLHSKDCDLKTGIWLIFAGDVATPTVSTAGDNYRTPAMHFRMKGKEYFLKKDDNFRRFYALMTAVRDEKPAYRVTATLRGAFFSERKGASDESEWGGYGHLGCCDLFVITGVSDVESDPPANLEIGGVIVSSAGAPISGVKVTSETLGCCQPQREEATTDNSGQFRFSYGGQMLHFRKNDLRPLSVFVEQPRTDLHVTLVDSQPTDWIIKSCSQAKLSTGWVGFKYKFFAGHAASEHLKSDEYDYDFYSVDSHHAHEDLVISGEANDSHNDSLAASSTFQERWIKNEAGAIIGIDLRGVMRAGSYWRTAVFSSDGYASYGVKAREDATFLDRIMDSACAVPR